MNGGRLIQEGILWHPKLTASSISKATQHFREQAAGQDLLDLTLNPQDRLQPNEEEQLSAKLHIRIVYDREIPQGNVWWSRRSSP